jgi:hypothetical protein
VLWFVTLCRWIIVSPRSFETSGNTNPVTERHILKINGFSRSYKLLKVHKNLVVLKRKLDSIKMSCQYGVLSVVKYFNESNRVNVHSVNCVVLMS